MIDDFESSLIRLMAYFRNQIGSFQYDSHKEEQMKKPALAPSGIFTPPNPAQSIILRPHST